jgi:hypothetical protein
MLSGGDVKMSATSVSMLHDQLEGAVAYWRQAADGEHCVRVYETMARDIDAALSTARSASPMSR